VALDFSAVGQSDLPRVISRALAFPLNAQAVAVMLHFVGPIRPGRDDGGLGRDAELKVLKHVANISVRRVLCEGAHQIRRDHFWPGGIAPVG
jgi:hypothetical protein